MTLLLIVQTPIIGELRVIPDALDGEFGPVVRLLVLPVEPERRGDAVDDPDMSTKASSKRLCLRSHLNSSLNHTR